MSMSVGKWLFGAALGCGAMVFLLGGVTVGVIWWLTTAASPSPATAVSSAEAVDTSATPGDVTEIAAEEPVVAGDETREILAVVEQLKTSLEGKNATGAAELFAPAVRAGYLATFTRQRELLPALAGPLGSAKVVQIVRKPNCSIAAVELKKGEAVFTMQLVKTERWWIDRY